MYNKRIEIKQVENGWIVSYESQIGDGTFQILEFVFRKPDEVVVFLSDKFDWAFVEMVKDLEGYT